MEMLRATFWAGKASGCALQGHPEHMEMLCEFWVGAGPVRPGLSPNSRTGTPVLLAVSMVAVRQGPISAVGARKKPREGPRMGASVRLFGEMGRRDGKWAVRMLQRRKHLAHADAVGAFDEDGGAGEGAFGEGGGEVVGGGEPLHIIGRAGLC